MLKNPESNNGRTKLFPLKTKKQGNKPRENWSPKRETVHWELKFLKITIVPDNFAKTVKMQGENISVSFILLADLLLS